MRAFIYTARVINNEDLTQSDTINGIVVGGAYGEAALRLEKYCTDPQGNCELIDMTLSEIECCDGIIPSDIIIDIADEFSKSEY